MLDQLAKLLAEDNIRLSTVASVPHMGGKRGKRQRSRLMHQWHQQTLDIETDIEVLRSASQTREWFAQQFEDGNGEEAA